ncbi:MAG TPA: acyltransferase [Rhizomicrobium sp.]|nr:acyltransferase [Rhizomicrobium sp.]
MKPAKAGTIAALAGARAFPPLLIILYHFSEGHHYSGLAWFDRIVTRGYMWVEFFFVLSGFILTHAYGPRLRDLLTPKGYGAFLRARLARLYPLHLFMLLVILAMVVTFRALAHAGGYVSIFDVRYHPEVNAWSFLLSVLLVQGWNTLPYLAWNGLSWFVSVEFALCLLFPAFLWLSHGRTWRGFALTGLGLAGMLALLFTSKHGLDITYHNGVLRGACDFAAGVGMAVLYRETAHRSGPAWIHSLVQVLLLLLLAYSFAYTGWSHTRNDIYTALPIMALVFALAFDKGVLAEALKTRVPQRMGEWSYAIYLGQTAWLQALRFFEQRLYPPGDTIVLGTRFADLIWWLEPLLLVIVCIGWGALLARYIEYPAAQWLRRRLGRRLDPQTMPTPS